MKRSLLGMGASLSALAAFLFSSTAVAAGGGDGKLVSVVNWYYLLTEAITHDAKIAGQFWLCVAAFGGLVALTAVGLFAGLHKLEPEKMSDEELLPPKNFGFRAFVELCFAVVSSTLESVLGEKKWQAFAPLLGGTFFYIIISNLTGLVPGFTPSTEHMNTTLAMALIIFVMFNYYGLKYAGIDYIKHMAGPLLVLAPLIFFIEIISLFARPMSLSLRLFGNVSGDHLVFSVFSTLVRDAGIPFVPVPAALLSFGLLVSCLQAFIFMTLSAVYIKLGVESAHEEAHH
ncbi:MAG: F0F1 ATP synthase subunit A [Silvanigrellales bacterium]|nr:F0F1 ATP synthase subunit A [Silvanigrellales bacterium]